jgi:hypothetical protein
MLYSVLFYQKNRFKTLILFGGIEQKMLILFGGIEQNRIFAVSKSKGYDRQRTHKKHYIRRI